MKAIIFAAGLGTRLKPHTNNCPKALVQLAGKPLLWHAINKLIETGVSEIIVNVHHFGEQIIDYLCATHFDVPIFISDERHVLLDTGGGLVKTQDFFSNTDAFIAFNVDVISSVNLKEVIDFHITNNAMATLVLRNRKTSRYLLFSDSQQLTGWKNIDSGEEKISKIEFIDSQAYAFSGIQVISSSIFKHITEKGKFSVIELYLRLAKTNKILGFVDDSEYWLDLGKPEQLLDAEKLLKPIN
ncbi:MAG: nucleotidyltransferase family protein [Prolixibacteraceae bacterium]|jgi:NDP-sugar pyrophosphorylase family protein|nr:nucleotidyltransferase family protein [Prolixibacteraceae bacterium]